MIAPRQTFRLPRRVLIVKPSALGDVVTAVPVLRGLRRTFPEAHIAWLLSTGCADLLKADEDLDEVILFDRQGLGRIHRPAGAARGLTRLLRALWKGNFDWVLDLQGLLRSGLLSILTQAPLRAGFADAREAAGVFYTHHIQVRPRHTIDRNIALARRLGIDARAEDLTLRVAPEGESFAEEFCRGRGLPRGGFLACVPPTRWATKRYPIRHWRKVLTSLAAEIPVVLLGSPGDRELCQTIAAGMGPDVADLTGRTSIPQMVALIAASAGVLCSDSAAKFIAPAVGVEAITLIGPTRVERTGPYRGGRAIVADVACRGCLKRHCRHMTCMQVIDPDDVISAARQMLSRRRG